MTAKNKKPSGWLNKLKNKYRLVILNDETFEERASIRLSRINVFVFASIFILLLIGLVVSTIVFTPLKEYIPGYADVTLRKELIELKLKVDSLELVIAQRNAWIDNVRSVLAGDVDTITEQITRPPIYYDTIKLDKIPLEDMLLREEIEKEAPFSLEVSGIMKPASRLKLYHFFPPVKGFVTADFNPDIGHYGIDLVAPENEPVKAILDGTVILSSWTLETGYVIAIQHRDDLVSLYKHNSMLLKKVGTFVSAGEVIAIIGSSGELSTGPHLHVELWHNGMALNPADYIVF